MRELRWEILREIVERQKQHVSSNLTWKTTYVNYADRLAKAAGGVWQDGLTEGSLSSLAYNWLWQKDQDGKTPEEVVLRHLRFPSE